MGNKIATKSLFLLDLMALRYFSKISGGAGAGIELYYEKLMKIVPDTVKSTVNKKSLPCFRYLRLPETA